MQERNQLAQGVNILLEWERKENLILMWTHTCKDPEKHGDFTTGCKKCK